MSDSTLARGTGPLCVAAAVLVVLSQLLSLGIGLVGGPGSTSTVTHTVTYGLALLGMGVTARRRRRHPRPVHGRLDAVRHRRVSRRGIPSTRRRPADRPRDRRATRVVDALPDPA